MSVSKIPRTDSIEELARFWDTHDLTDFEDELEEVSGPVFHRRREGELRIHLRPEDRKAIETIARSQGTDLQALILSWILEKLKSPSRSPR